VFEAKDERSLSLSLSFFLSHNSHSDDVLQRRGRWQRRRFLEAGEGVTLFGGGGRGGLCAKDQKKREDSANSFEEGRKEERIQVGRLGVRYDWRGRKSKVCLRLLGLYAARAPHDSINF
jgi:hypothetical protein